MNHFVVPELSDLCTVVIAWFGRFTPGLMLAIAGSFQFWMLPKKMSAIIGPVSFRPVLTPGRLYDRVIAPIVSGITTAGLDKAFL